jgi:opacity protein-like surface antigen
MQLSNRVSLLLVLLGLVLLASPAANSQTPLPAGRSSALDFALGYTDVQMTVPGSGHVNMTGADATMTAQVVPRIGIAMDLTYARSHEVFGTGHHNDMLSYLAGPVFYVARQRRTTLFTSILVGAARLNGINFSQTGSFFSGYVVKPAWSGGVGLQHAITPTVSLRLGVDYLRTTFFDHTSALKGEGSLRTSATVVYTFGRGRRR